MTKTAFSDGLKLEERYYLGPIKMNLSLFERISGPEPGLKYVTCKETFFNKVNNIKEKYLNGWDMPPLIINYEDGIFELNDGNHRFEALQQLGVQEYYVIIWFTKKECYDSFIEKHL